MSKIAIIGGGIVGLTCAYYLSKKGKEVVLYDVDKGQATKAAAGIICPWVSQRRNQDWYELVVAGARFYPDFIKELAAEAAYLKVGTVMTHPSKLEKLLELSLERRKTAPEIGHLEMGASVLAHLPPSYIGQGPALWIEGGAYVDGAQVLAALFKKLATMAFTLISEPAVVVGDCVNDVAYDTIVVAAGAWIPDVLPEYKVDIRPQKGQLIEYEASVPKEPYAVLMPQGEIDLLFPQDGRVIVGASHEDDKGYDSAPDAMITKNLHEQASHYLANLNPKAIQKIRVGIRGYTSDYNPFYGRISNTSMYAIGGLGSTGLTMGPLLGYRIAQMILGNTKTLDIASKYVHKKPAHT